jgi:Na+/proline symporter
MTSDVYRKMRKTEPTQRDLLRVVRICSLFCGVLMLVVAVLLRKFGSGGAVKANLIMVSILDLPLFVVTIIYGIFWRRTNWQGATAGFVIGSIVGASTYGFVSPDFFSKCIAPFFNKISPAALAHLTHWHDVLMAHHFDVRTSNVATMAGFLTALIVTPVVSLLTRRNDVKKVNAIQETFTPDTGDGVHDSFRVFPNTAVGRFAVVLVLGGFLGFLASVAWGARSGAYASAIAIGCMLVTFAGGLIRVYAD